MYVEFILRQILSWGAKKGERRIEGATEWDAEVLLSNEVYFLTQRDFACLYQGKNVPISVLDAYFDLLAKTRC